MKKTNRFVISLLLVVMMLSTMCVNAFADGNVIYDGNAQAFVFAPGSDESPSDLFTDFKEVMPGDTLTQQVVIKNTASKNVTVRIYMRALGAKSGCEEFLNQMNLTVSGSEKMFNAPADHSAADWYCLGEFAAGEKVTLDVTLEVPLTMNNDFANAIGYLDWQFLAEEIAVSQPVNPKTGDTMNMFLWIGMIVISAAVIVVLVAVDKRQKTEIANTKKS